MQKENCQLLVVSALDEIAWLFNLRGSDISYNPVFFSYAIVGPKSAQLFVEGDRLEKSAKDSLAKLVTVLPYASVASELGKACKRLSGGQKSGDKNGAAPGNNQKKIWIPSSTSEALVSIVPAAVRFSRDSPLQLMKAIKNETELAGMRYAHVKDAVAHCEFLHWIEGVMAKGNKEGLTEIGVADKFLELRKAQLDFVDLSFPTISSTAGHAAMNHYQPTPETDIVVSSKELYLVDSGGQYKDGTTDVTRTLAFVPPNAYHRECYTRVLKGHIDLAMLVFPDKTSGYRLDSFARRSLWDVGLEYRHGTGHGVGHYLNVHEGPAGFHFREGASTKGIQAGMCITIEPGYYEDGKFGIRIENVYIIVEKYPAGKSGSDSPAFLTSESITLVPLDKSLIDPKLLNAEEIAWINDYHATVARVVGEELRKQGKDTLLPWLEEQCAPLG